MKRGACSSVINEQFCDWLTDCSRSVNVYMGVSTNLMDWPKWPVEREFYVGYCNTPLAIMQTATPCLTDNLQSQAWLLRAGEQAGRRLQGLFAYYPRTRRFCAGRATLYGNHSLKHFLWDSQQQQPILHWPNLFHGSARHRVCVRERGFLFGYLLCYFLHLIHIGSHGTFTSHVSQTVPRIPGNTYSTTPFYYLVGYNEGMSRMV